MLFNVVGHRSSLAEVKSTLSMDIRKGMRGLLFIAGGRKSEGATFVGTSVATYSTSGCVRMNVRFLIMRWLPAEFCICN